MPAASSAGGWSRSISKTLRVIRTLTLDGGYSAPQDVKLAPDGRTIYVADQDNAGVWESALERSRWSASRNTGAGAHGLYPSRNARFLYVSNREAGSVSVMSFATNRVVKTWQLPLPASPDMGGVSADGRTLWLSGRYNGSRVRDQHDHRQAARHDRGRGRAPTGCVSGRSPEPYSLGHTGIMR